MKIIVAHEGKQHSFRTAEALYRKGYLFKYITTVYDKPWNLTRGLKYLLRGNAKKKCSSRRTEALPDSFIQQYDEWKGLLLLFLSHIPWLYSKFPRYYDWLHDSFGEKVARYAIKHQVDAVIMYDTNCNRCWEILKEEAPQIRRLMDVSIANRLFMKENYLTDIQRTNDVHIKQEQIELWDEKNIKRYLGEIQDSEYFLIASSMVKRSMMFSGVEEHQMFLAPYGVEHNKFAFIQKKEITPPLKLIYVGQVTYRKGMHHLLNVVSSFPKGQVELYLAGRYEKNASFHKSFCKFENIHFLGFITRDVLAHYYQDSDVFVFPTLGEGYGLVILEALSCGVPCIVSNLAGGDDAIEDGVNGFVFEGGNDAQLHNRIQWFIDNPNKLPQMSQNARNSVLKQTWESYYEHVTNAIEQICQ